MSFNYWQALEPGQTYHIYNKATSGNRIFLEDIDFQGFLKRWEKYFGKYLDTYAYCLVPNHFHFLARVRVENELLHRHIGSENTKAGSAYLADRIPLSAFLSDQLRRFGSSISLSHRAKYQRDGPLLVNKTKRISLRSDPHLLYVLCYIHHNVIHHELGVSYEDWIYSSYRAYLSPDLTNFAQQQILDWMGGIDEFKSTHRAFKEDFLHTGRQLKSLQRIALDA